MRKLVWMCMCDVDKFMNANILYICIRIYVYKSLPDPICSLFVPAVQKSCSCKKLGQTEKYVFLQWDSQLTFSVFSVSFDVIFKGIFSRDFNL